MKFENLNSYKKPAVVMTALAFDENDKENLISQMNEVFTEMGFLRNGARVVDVEKVEGNVLGDEGRTDVIITLDKFDVNCLARLKMPDIKWVEDFVANYGADYGFEPSGETDEDYEAARRSK